MIKYSDKVRQDALDTYRNEGIKVACERYHMPSSTIYRWLSIEKREAMLANVAQESGNGASGPIENKGGNSSTIQMYKEAGKALAGMMKKYIDSHPGAMNKGS